MRHSPVTDASTAGTDAHEPRPGSRAILAWSIAVCAAAFLFRFVTVDFPNDHFVHLSRARQILLGEVPVRDFFDPGLPLHYYASVPPLLLSGGTLFGEAVLTCAFMAVGAALTFWLAARMSRSSALGLAAAAVTVVSSPRLYNYPKVFLYVLALACGWWFVQRRHKAALGVLALVTALAFLFRHDHGLYIGVSLVALMVLLHAPDWRAAGTSVATYGSLTAILLLPFFVFIQSTAGLASYAQGGEARSLLTLYFNRLPMTVDWTLPLVVVDPPRERRINIRWVDDLDEQARREREARFGLTSPEPAGGTTWSYVPSRDDAQTIAGLLSDPGVEDTHGIDREALRLAIRETPYQRLQRRLPFLRMHLAPGIVTTDNAVAGLYYMALSLPLVACLTLLAAWVGHRISRPEAALVGAATLLCAIIVQTLVRGSPDSRLPDIAAPLTVLAAWVTGYWVSVEHPSASAYRLWLRRGLVAILWCVVFWNSAVLGNLREKLEGSNVLSGPTATLDRVAEVTDALKQRPIDGYAGADATGLRALTRYVFDCTTPDDRLLVTWFEPEVFFYAERPFAGGQVYLYPGWHSSESDQRLTVARMERQRVPLVLVNEAVKDLSFVKGFPLVYAYVMSHYDVAATSGFGADAPLYSVLVRRDIRPTGTYRRFGLPCFR